MDTHLPKTPVFVLDGHLSISTPSEAIWMEDLSPTSFLEIEMERPALSAIRTQAARVHSPHMHNRTSSQVYALPILQLPPLHNLNWRQGHRWRLRLARLASGPHCAHLYGRGSGRCLDHLADAVVNAPEPTPALPV